MGGGEMSTPCWRRAEVLGCRVREEAGGMQGAGGGASAGGRMGVGFRRRGFRMKEGLGGGEYAQ